MASVNKASQLNRRGPSHVEDRLDRGSNRTSGIDHVIDQNNLAVVDRVRYESLVDNRVLTEEAQVITIERDIQKAQIRLMSFYLSQFLDNASAKGTPRR